MDLSEIVAFKKRVKDEGKNIVGSEFAKFFEAHPEVKSVRWRQYTPHFNDGDACTFGRHEFESLGKNPDGGDYGDGYESAWGHKHNKDEAQAVALEALRTALGSGDLDDLFLAAFGDGVQVTASPAGFEVEEYSHD